MVNPCIQTVNEEWFRTLYYANVNKINIFIFIWQAVDLKLINKVKSNEARFLFNLLISY